MRPRTYHLHSCSSPVAFGGLTRMNSVGLRVLMWMCRSVFAIAIVALGFGGCAYWKRDLPLQVSAPLQMRSGDQPTFFVESDAAPPSDTRGKGHFCALVERELVRRGWRSEPAQTACFRVLCATREIAWRRVNRVPVMPMTRMWYLRSMYDPHSEGYRLPGKSGLYRPERSTVEVSLFRARSIKEQSPVWSASMVREGFGVERDVVSRLFDGLVAGEFVSRP